MEELSTRITSRAGHVWAKSDSSASRSMAPPFQLTTIALTSGVVKSTNPCRWAIDGHLNAPSGHLQPALAWLAFDGDRRVAVFVDALFVIGNAYWTEGSDDDAFFSRKRKSTMYASQ